ncbi:hypothetical protein RJ639_021225 [Escallonia herrerae]|uniref:Leucine-rich repeat-containing N-terminal plant-type domain-containing protein n=1 Tax=Escallonia herrerae TaxID=1293975 RepID=A0AA89AHE0_9ASTE|nr:hypothetical protein RJ639_021225 [Escallonia herrerae]
MSRCHGCLEAERLALLQIKASINHPNGTSLPEWKDDNTSDCCHWDGIDCHEVTRSVIALDLFNKRLDELGDWCLNASLFRPFESLTDLHLSFNKLLICTNDEGVENQLSKLRNLEVLDLRRRRWMCGGRRTNRLQATRDWTRLEVEAGADEGGGPVREALGFVTAAEGVERGLDLRWHTAAASSVVEEEKDRRGTWGFEVVVES